jgi:starch synthase
MIVTNDWFTGLVAAYAKHHHFGPVFNSSKFLHIVHNLDPSYEGRMSAHEVNILIREISGTYINYLLIN